MRCFVGIPLSSETREALVSACNAVRAADREWSGEKWVAAENLHVTVAFLGEVAETSIVALTDAIGVELAAATRFELPFAELRAVPNTRRATMLWAAYRDVEGSGAALVSAIARAGALFDITLEARAFKPHVTLVRCRRTRRVPEAVGDALASHASAVPPLMSVSSATLFASTLGKLGPRYESLHTWELPAPKK